MAKTSAVSKSSKSTKLPGVTIKQDDTAPEVLAEAIVQVANGAQRLLNSRLTKRAIMVLIRDSISGNIAMRDIQAVLEAAANLDRTALKPGKQGQ